MRRAAKNARGWGLATFTLLLAGAAPASEALDPATTNPAPADSTAWAAAIERLNALDPQAPNTLEARLGYADFLLQTDDGDCRRRLDEAQTQLDIASATPATAVVLASGLAHASAVEYEIHAARAGCGSDDPEPQLRAALAAAQRSVILYREAFDAVAMTTMQYNTSVAYRKLGDEASAVAALKATIALDSEYGYRDDAADNYALLLRWSGETASSERVAELMKDFPQRSVNLTFRATESDILVNYSADITRVLGDAVLQARGYRSALRHLEKHGKRWRVVYQPAAVEYELASLPKDSDELEDYLVSLNRMLFNFHDLEINADGDFDQSTGAAKFGQRVRADMRALLDRLQQNGAERPLKRRFENAAVIALTPDVREAQVAEDYNLEQGTWLGGMLEQGVWYELSAPLSMPLAPQTFVLHKIEFAYTRSVPCAAKSKDPACVELVLHAQPDPGSLRSILQQAWGELHLPHRLVPRLSWDLKMRLVVDPATLRPYLRDTRSHSYVSREMAAEHTLIEAQKTVYSYSVDGPKP